MAERLLIGPSPSHIFGQLLEEGAAWVDWSVANRLESEVEHGRDAYVSVKDLDVLSVQQCGSRVLFASDSSWYCRGKSQSMSPSGNHGCRPHIADSCMSQLSSARRTES
jgi:hypothetical protein